MREGILDEQVHGGMGTRLDAHTNWWAYGKLVTWWVIKQAEGTVSAQRRQGGVGSGGQPFSFSRSDRTISAQVSTQTWLRFAFPP